MDDTYYVRYAYEAVRSDELTLQEGMVLKVLERGGDGWWKGSSGGVEGWFPASYVEPSSRNDQNCIHVVQAIYQFNANTTEELSFAQGEKLEVIGLPVSDPEWYQARNVYGEIGLIPQTYVLILPNATADSCQTNNNNDPCYQSSPKPWLLGPMQRTDAVKILKSCNIKNTFLVRGYTPDATDFTISAKFAEDIRHFKILINDNMLCCGGKKFANIDEVIKHFTHQKPIYVDKNDTKWFLGQPIQSANNLIM